MHNYLNPDGTIKTSAISQDVPEFMFAVREDIDDPLSRKQFLPTRATSTDTGWDVRCAEPDGVKLSPFMHAKIRLGIRMFAPPGWWLELRPRSSTHAKKHLSSLYGVIDEGYENEILFSCQYIPSDSFCIPKPTLEIAYGEKIGQVRPVKRQEMLVFDVSNTEFDRLCSVRNGLRGKGGFGSTG